MEKTARTCFHCYHFRLCCLRHDIEDVTRKHIGMLAIDRQPEVTGVTGVWLDIFVATAAACTSYIFQEEK